MASFWYNNAKALLLKGDLDFDTMTIIVKLVMTNTTCDTETDETIWSGFATPDLYDGSGYSSPQAAAAQGLVVSTDNTNNRGEVDVNDFTFGSAVAAGTRSAQGMVVCKYVNGTTSDVPIAFIDTGGFPFAGNGGAVNVTVHAEGLLWVT